MSYGRDRDAHTRGTGAIAAVDNVSSRLRNENAWRALQMANRDRRLAHVAQGAFRPMGALTTSTPITKPLYIPPTTGIKPLTVYVPPPTTTTTTTPPKVTTTTVNTEYVPVLAPKTFNLPPPPPPPTKTPLPLPPPVAIPVVIAQPVEPFKMPTTPVATPIVPMKPLVVAPSTGGGGGTWSPTPIRNTGTPLTFDPINIETESSGGPGMSTNMKYLLLAAAGVGGYLLWRSGRD